MSGDVRVDRVEVNLESLSVAEAQVVAAALPGALAGQMALWPLPLPRLGRAAPPPDNALSALADEIAAQILELIALQAERNGTADSETDEDAPWH